MPGDENYTYDANGNRTFNGASQTIGTNNELLTDAAGFTYLYDAEGNCTAKFQTGSTVQNNQIPADATNITVYTWDYRDRLTEVQSFDNYTDYHAGIATQTVTYTYDYLNRLVGETAVTGSGSTEQTVQTAYVYDGTDVILKFQNTTTGGPASGSLAAGNLTDRYLWGSAVDQVLADENVALDQSPSDAGAVLWGLADLNGSIADIVDNVGHLADHRVYDSFGNQVFESTPGTPFMFGFDGAMLDTATGLQYDLNRWYDPTTGRWMSQDPLGLGPDANFVPVLRE